jgi:methyltransferase
MPVYLWILLIGIIVQRLVELVIAKRNELWIIERGGIERGKEHYKWFIIVHTLFFCSLLLEITLLDFSQFKLSIPLFFIFMVTQFFRIWCIQSLGKFWNTKILILPNHTLISKGPYRFIKHPNYIIVGIELFIIPLLFGAMITATLFPILHLLLMTVRIPAENKALAERNEGTPG